MPVRGAISTGLIFCAIGDNSHPLLPTFATFVSTQASNFFEGLCANFLSVTSGKMRVRFVLLWLAVLFVSAGNAFSIDHADKDFIRSTDFSLFEENGKVGLKDQAGEILIPATYDAIGWSNGKLSIVDKVVGYQSNGLWGLIHTSNKLVTAAEFLDLVPGEGSFLVAQKKSHLTQRPSFGIINTSGKVVVPFVYDGLKLSNMRAVIMSRSGTKFEFGLIDLSHKILIPIQYQRIYSLGSLRYAVENQDRKIAIFSDDGTQISPFNIDSLSAFRKDYAVIYQGQKQGLIDRNGAIVVRPEHGEVRLEDDGAVLIRETNTWYFLHGDNKLMAEHRVDDVRPLSADRYAISSNGKLQLTGNDLKPLHEDFFSSIGDFTHGIACYRKNSHTGVITADGKTLIEPRYRELIIEPHGFRACLDTGSKNRWVILDKQGSPISEKYYEYVAPFTGKFHPVKNRGFWGAVDAAGVQVVTCVHDSLIQELNDNVVVKFKGEYGVINLRENWIVTPQPNPLKLLNEELYMEYADNTTFIKSFEGDIVYFSENPLDYRGGYIREQLASGAYWTIDPDGIVIERSNQPELVEKVFEESEGLRAILKDGKFGFIDDAGRLRIANRYQDARPFSEGLAAIRIRGKWGFIDRHEKLVVQPVYDEVGKFINGKAIVTQEGLSGLIDEQGRIVLPLRYHEISPNAFDRFLLRQGKTYGLADAAGVVIIHPRYDALTDAGNGYVIVQRDGKFGALTLQGVNTIPMIYDGLTFDPYHNQFMAVKKSKWEVFRTSHSGQ